MHVVQTACFDQALNQIWYDKLATSNNRALTKPALLLSVFLVGLPAPFIIEYEQKENRIMPETQTKFTLSKNGINYYLEKELPKKRFTHKGLRDRWIYFHLSPMVKMCYHFVFYIWFLLAFSYMMLCHFDAPTVSSPHWTEIYTIITVSTMVCEEFRQFRHNYVCKMTEHQNYTGFNVLTAFTNSFSILPYILFYIGIGFRYGSGDNDNLLTVARIILALDLEMWYLQSLKFVIALKSLGPKLFMLKNMLRDLFAFIYIIFVATAAYGVVSRSLFKYNEFSFDATGIFREIFYAPYWFMYGEFSDKDQLDSMSENKNSTAESTATQVLLAFHMLFINILLLNLLIAVFADTIGKVQQNTEFYWRYQRYSFVREYFDRPILAYPPLIFFTHAVLLIRCVYQKFYRRNQVNNEHYQGADDARKFSQVFKMIAEKDSMLDEHWNTFEHAATHSYARSSVEYKKTSNDKSDSSSKTTSLSEQFESTTHGNGTLKENKSQQETIANVKEELTSMRSTMIELQTQLNQRNATIESLRNDMELQSKNVNASLTWIMDAMERARMNSDKNPRPDKTTVNESSSSPTTNT